MIGNKRPEALSLSYGPLPRFSYPFRLLSGVLGVLLALSLAVPSLRCNVYYRYLYMSIGEIYKDICIFLCRLYIDICRQMLYTDSILERVSVSPGSQELEVNKVAVSKAQQRAVTKYDAKAYDKTLLRLPKGKLDVVRTHASILGESVNGFIGRAISETMERDTSQKPSESPVRAASPLVGIITPDTLKDVQEAVESTGEDVPAFITRAVDVQLKRDKIAFDMGVNPATGEKLKG